MEVSGIHTVDNINDRLIRHTPLQILSFINFEGKGIFTGELYRLTNDEYLIKVQYDLLQYILINDPHENLHLCLLHI